MYSVVYGMLHGILRNVDYTSLFCIVLTTISASWFFTEVTHKKTHQSLTVDYMNNYIAEYLSNIESCLTESSHLEFVFRFICIKVKVKP